MAYESQEGDSISISKIANDKTFSYKSRTFHVADAVISYPTLKKKMIKQLAEIWA